MQGSISQEPHHTEIYRKNAAPQNRGAGLVRACAVEMQVNISHYTEICQKNAVPLIEPRTQTHTLCESPEPKCAPICHKSRFVRKFTGKMLHPHHRGADFLRACAVEMHFNILKEPLFREIYTKNAAPRIEPRTQCESPESKCTSICHKSRFVRKFTGKMLRPHHRGDFNILQEPLHTEIYRKNAVLPPPRRRLCASLRSRNASKHFTRAT